MTASTQYLADNLDRILGYGNELLADVPADRFTFMPHPNFNHPAWIVGHVAIYPDHFFEMLGHPELQDVRDGYEKLFGYGSDCVDDPAMYPGKDDLVDYFTKQHRNMVELLRTVGDDVLDRPAPSEEMADRFPTIGHAVHFLFSNHISMHLGQISVWRRTIGLGKLF